MGHLARHAETRRPAAPLAPVQTGSFLRSQLDAGFEEGPKAPARRADTSARDAAAMPGLRRARQVARVREEPPTLREQRCMDHRAGQHAAVDERERPAKPDARGSDTNDEQVAGPKQGSSSRT